MNFQPLKDFLDFYLPMLGVPGSDTSVYRGHEEIFRYQSGYDNLRFRTPVRDNALYNVYSITKVSCAVAATQLIERGEILVNDPVYAYFPEYRDITVRRRTDSGEEVVPAKNTLLVKHLLTMTGGLDYDIERPALQEVIRRTEGRAPTLEVVRALARDPFVFEPGEGFKYSLCLDVMGGIIELVSGMKLSEYMRENIFEPLGMNNTYFGMTDDIRSRLATQYSYDSEHRCATEMSPDNRFTFGSEYESAGGGLISCVADQALLADALANGGVGKNGERILSRFGIGLMSANALDGKCLEDYRKSGLSDSVGYGYGYGVRVNMKPCEAGNLSPVGEFGWDGAKGCYMLVDPVNSISFFHAEHMGGLHRMIEPRLRNLVYSCIGE